LLRRFLIIVRGKKSQSGSTEVPQFADKPECRGSFFITFRPKTGAGVSGEELEAAELLAAYRPDYFVSGHNHAFPYESGQSWNPKLGESSLLVPGQLLNAPFPNYIEIDTESGELSWHTASETWIAEDGLYDHLTLKLTKDRSTSMIIIVNITIVPPPV
jgi:hypothetical protein